MFKNINNTYLKEEVFEEMIKFFEDENFIQLNDFLNLKMVDEIFKNLNKQNFTKIYNPIKYKFGEFNYKNIYDLEIIKIIEFFKSKEFLEYIEKIVEINLNFIDLKIRKYTNKDFTLLHDEQKEEDRIEVIFDLSNAWKEEFGGILTYTTKKDEIFYLDPQFNTLTILYKPDSVMKYLKFINNKAQNREILRFEMKFEIEN